MTDKTLKQKIKQLSLIASESNDPLHAAQRRNQKAANKLRKLRIKNRRKRAAANKKSGLRRRIK